MLSKAQKKACVRMADELCERMLEEFGESAQERLEEFTEDDAEPAAAAFIEAFKAELEKERDNITGIIQLVTEEN